MENVLKSVKISPEKTPETPETPETPTPEKETPTETPEQTPESTETPQKETATPEQTPEKAETPPEKPAEQGQPEQIDINELLRKDVGMTVEEVRQLKEQYESIKDRPIVDDPELIPDDDFTKEFLQAYKRGGKDVALQYLKANTTDFGKQSDEEIVKYELRKQNPGLSEKFFDRMYKDYLRDKFGFREEYDNDDDEQYAQERLRIHAQQKRQEFSEELKKFQIPEREAKREEPIVDEAKVEAFIKTIEQDPATRSLVNDKKIVFDDFNYQVDAEALKNAAIDGQQFFKLFLNEDGSYNLDKYYKAVAFAQDPDTFLKSRDAHVLAKGKVEWMKELKNPSEDPKPKPPTGQIKVRIV